VLSLAALDVWLRSRDRCQPFPPAGVLHTVKDHRRSLAVERGEKIVVKASVPIANLVRLASEGKIGDAAVRCGTFAI
jgi:hypothetical protein